MKVLTNKGVANQFGPESCVVVREDDGEALTGERAGRVLSREIHEPLRERWRLRGADAVEIGGRQHRRRRYRETPKDPARSETPSTHGITAHGNREIPRSSAKKGGNADRIGKSKDERR